MVYFRSVGTLPVKAHTVLRIDGRFIHEELFSTAGFSGSSCLVYRLNAPTRVVRVEGLKAEPVVACELDTVCNRMFKIDQMPMAGDFADGRTPLLFNDDFVYSIARVNSGMDDFFRNSYQDELVFVAKGTGTVQTTFGTLSFQPLDIIYIPRGTTVQWRPDAGGEQVYAVVESNSAIEPPIHFRAPSGQLLDAAPYHERDLRVPELPDPVDESGEFTIRVKTGDVLSRYIVDRHPFDVIGWNGSFYPFAFNLKDFEPLSGRTHVMPDQYQFLATKGASFCALVPFRAEDHPDASPTQPHHNNVDFDEINFRVLSLDDRVTDSRIGNVAHQPRAFAHGPRPGFETAPGPMDNPLYALMIDAMNPLKLTAAARDANYTDYLDEWC